MPLSGAVPIASIQRAYIQSVETADRILTLSDAFVLLYANNGALVFTVPPFIDVEYIEGTQISLLDLDGGAPVFAPGAGVTINSSGGLGPSAQFVIASIILSPTPDTWTAVGGV